MNLVAILAGGVGRRMNGGVLPKQFIEVKGVPIIITTLKKCLNVKKNRHHLHCNSSIL